MGRVSSSPGWVEDWRSSVNAGIPHGRPFVTAAFALGADGCLAQRKGHATTLSSPDSQCVTHLLRSMNDAVLVGLGTVLADDPLLTTRLVDGPTGQRVVLDSMLRTPITARLIKATERPLVFFGCRSADRHRAELLRAVGAEVEQLGTGERGVDLHAMLTRLQARAVSTVGQKACPILA